MPLSPTAIGFIFDWDGVVVDSSKQHEESWERLSAARGLPLYEGHFKAGFGKKNSFIIPNMLKWSSDAEEIERLGDQKEAYYREIVRESGLEALPGVAAFLSELKSSGCHACVGSSTPRENIETVMSLIRLEGAFVDIVAAEDVGKGKPDPEVFLKAASALRKEPERCVVFEDSYSGIEAALAGGMMVVAIATTHRRNALEGRGAHLIAESFLDFDLPRIAGLFG